MFLMGAVDIVCKQCAVQAACHAEKHPKHLNSDRFTLTPEKRKGYESTSWIIVARQYSAS
jgi:hypothetical protein